MSLFFLFQERNQLLHSGDVLHSSHFWLEMSIGGLFGFGMGLVTGLQIKLTSPLTHNISGLAKSATQTVMATKINHEVKSNMWWLDNVLVLAGSLLYARTKQGEAAEKEEREDRQKSENDIV